jgi:hypothetical protein
MFALASLMGADLAAAAEPPVPPAKEAKVCRGSEKRTGSHVRTGRRCKTAEQWLVEDEERSRIPVTLTVTEGQGDSLTKQRPQ